MDFVPVALDYEEHGDGLPLVLLHGFPLNRTIWNPVVPLLKGHTRVILPDLRGYGSSPAGSEDVHSMRLLAEDVLHLLDRLNIERAVVGGHSMGGYVALAFARAYPHRLAGLALIASTTSADLPERRQSRLVMARNVKRRGTAVISKRLPASMTDDPKIASQISEMILATPSATVVGNLKGMAERDDASEWVHNLCVPTLVLAGQEDKIIPVDKPRTFVQFFPRSWLIEIPGAGHMVPMEAPEPVAKALKVLVRRAESVQVQE